jgi:TolB-like protein
MKRCPHCNRVEPDEALKFCRVDGTVLVEDSTIADEYSSTRVLPSAQTGEASVVHTDSGHPPGTTRGLAQAKPATVATAGLANRVAVAESPVMRLNRHRTAAIIIAALAIIGVVVFSYFYFTRRSTATIDSIAVLPFENQNHDPNTDYLADGVTENIINSLTQLSNLKVSPRSSVFRYKGKETDPVATGKELGVRAILSGRILQRGDDLIIGAEPVDVRDNKQLWGEQYNEKVSDLLSVQREIAQKISSNLRLKLSGAEQSRITKHYTESPEAYQLYLKGRFYWNERTAESLKKSIEYFNQAIERDPHFALAFAGLADGYALLSSYGAASTRESKPKAKAAALKALEIDDTLADAHTALAYELFYFEWNFAESNKEFRRAIELNPNYATAHHWYGETLASSGRFDEAIAESKRAQELEPHSLIIMPI